MQLLNQYTLTSTLLLCGLAMPAMATTDTDDAQTSTKIIKETAKTNVSNNSANTSANTSAKDTEVLRIWGKSLNADEPGYTSPESLLLPSDMKAINAVTTEDLEIGRAHV